ncbi:hypothetical protein SNE40_018654 [Patella caerulea]|uniref:U5 small nuclear ribonucleoprotein 200 kDa helicase n=1 Tax=Patella caerulea TaxID=87958 RepID=A0AAN8P8G9_PATCE
MNLPRLSGALRVFANVSANVSDQHEDDISSRRRSQRQNKTKEGLTWKELNSAVRKNAKVDSKIYNTALKELISCAKSIVSTDSDGETIEAAAAFLFELFKTTDVVSQRETVRLRNTFGPFPASAATKTCDIVKRISAWLPDDFLEISDSKRGDGDGEADDFEFGSGIKFSEFSDDFDQDFSSSESEDEKEVKDWDIEYTASSSNSGTICYLDNNDQDRGPKAKKDMKWLETEIRKYFVEEETSLGMPVSQLTSTVFDVLSSTRSDNELQNELFDLLGFDRFELIQMLLENRKKVVKSVVTEVTKAVLSAMPKPKVDRPTYGCQVTVQSEEEKRLVKLYRKEEKKASRKGGKKGDETSHDKQNFDPRELKYQREAALRSAATAPLFRTSRVTGNYAPREKFPFVFDTYEEARQSSAFVGGTKLCLPTGFDKTESKLYDEINIPPSDPAPTDIGNKLVPIASLDEIGQLAFKGTKTLNRIQSVVFESAYNTNENLLICAPTGAGKTNVAMLTILHEINQHLSQGVIKKDEFKVVYIAPMKALAAEMVRNFGGRLAPLGISVRELTGDMSLTKQEILKTQMLVTTPEKWDVVTRKSTGDVALSQLVRLLIIDEVHLLHDDRGPVIETLVARTIRQVESSQSMIRIVGLSATLPNYIDVARFLNVNPYLGLFFFDGRFRPVPLGQTFIGIKTTNKVQQLQDFNTVCYEKVVEDVRKGHQVMVFVHARNETVRTAMTLLEMARNQGDIQLFAPNNSSRYGDFQKSASHSRNRQLKELLPEGFGIHHAGMLRQDRNLVEKYFADGMLKVICCTATLAWGVNLPAHAVIIKGTQLYDAKRGSFVDLGILDVMQIFGRAGRPQYDKFGHGTIITTHDKLSRYLSLMTRQNPIESQFIASLTDNLNAEIALGTVTNVEEAVKWISYTYLFVRMRINPLAYGVPYTALETDPRLEKYRYDLIVSAGRKLDKTKMIRFNEAAGYFFSTDLGRISSHFYIKYDTVEVINESFVSLMNEADILAVVSRAQEFDQIKVREDEMVELDMLMNHDCVMDVPGGKENTHGKVNILLQSYISRAQLQSFSLISDQAYVAQNAARIIRALFEMALKQGWPLMASRLLMLCKVVDKRLWGCDSPLHQFPLLNPELIYKLEEKNLTIDRLRDMDAKEIGHMIHHVRMGSNIKRCVEQIPTLSLDATIQPITRTVLRVRLNITPEFNWDDKVHGSVAEPFQIWVEDPENNHIYHSEYFMLHKKQVKSGDVQTLVFTIPIFEPLPSQYYVKAVSDRWLGSECVCAISFQHLILPEKHPPHTELLDLHPLPLTVLNDPKLESLYKFTHFNPVQTQIFHTLYHNDCNVLLGAPTGSGKTIAAELAIFRIFREYPGSKAVYIAPLKALVRERMEDWRVRFEQKLGKKVVELTGDVTPDMRAVAKADLIVTTPEKWDGVSRSWQTRNYVKSVNLLVIDEIHLLGDDRGPVLEVIVSRTNFISSHTEKPVRVVGLSTALANARDLADWLGIKQMGLFNFRPSVRPVPLEVHITGFTGQHYCPRMATMNKPTFQAVKTYSPSKPVLVFVSSRRQTRLTALDLIAFLAADENPKQWLHMPEVEVSHLYLSSIMTGFPLSVIFGLFIIFNSFFLYTTYVKVCESILLPLTSVTIHIRFIPNLQDYFVKLITPCTNKSFQRNAVHNGEPYQSLKYLNCI